MMFYGGNQNFIVFFQLVQFKIVCDQIDVFGGVMGLDDFVVVGCIKKLLYCFMCIFKFLCSQIIQGVGFVMYIGIDGVVVLIQCFNDVVWFLSGGGIVQINQRFVFDLLMQNRKICLYFGQIEMLLVDCCFVFIYLNYFIDYRLFSLLILLKKFVRCLVIIECICLFGNKFIILFMKFRYSMVLVIV